MKKRLFVSLALALAVMFGYSMQAWAPGYYIESCNIIANCVEKTDGVYVINYGVGADTYIDGLLVEYDLTIKNADGVTLFIENGDFTANTGSGNGSVTVADCGVYTIEGTVNLGLFPDRTCDLPVLTVVCTCDTPGDEGCTPGFWKNHLDAWEGTDLYPDDDFDTAFGVDLFDPDITLYEAVWARGGGNNKIARHGTAALLNAASENVEYPVSIAEVIQAVQEGDVESLVNYNEFGTEGFCD